MAKEFTVIIEQDEEGYFIAEVPELKGCHTQAKSLVPCLINSVRDFGNLSFFNGQGI